MPKSDVPVDAKINRDCILTKIGGQRCQASLARRVKLLEDVRSPHFQPPELGCYWNREQTVDPESPEQHGSPRREDLAREVQPRSPSIEVRADD